MPKPHLCLNMIVKNESARIVRALDSCKDYISTFAIFDTGSTDDTIALIRAWGETNGIKGIVAQGAFTNFSQARNQALEVARSWHRSAPWFDFILLMDADMELVIAHDSAFENLTGIVYDAVQRAGGFSYHNVRLVSVSSAAKYEGVTHEFFNAPPDGTLSNASFIDHADGANRVDKFARDIRLLTDDLDRDPDNARSWFYLANSYRDAGEHSKAAEAYRRRVALGGWDEEVWHAQLDLACCMKAQGVEDAFFKEAMHAYDMRPQRAETLHIIGKHLREAGQQRMALVFIEQGLATPKPADRLFVQDWMYEWGFREEYSICGFYGDAAQKRRGYEITDALATDPGLPQHVRDLARSNMAWYLPKLVEHAPSFETTEINFLPRKGYTAMNPSVCQRPNGGLEVLLRTVNYKMDSEGRYMIGEKECNDAPIDTENWLLSLRDDLTTIDWAKVTWDRPDPKFPQVTGLEDMRLFWHKGLRCFSATVREQSAAGQCEMWAGVLSRRFGMPERAQVIETSLISDPTKTEKNWMPVPSGTSPRWMYNLCTSYEPSSQLWSKTDYPFAVDNLRGSSQLVPFKGGFLAVVHEAIYRGGKRVYQHRFVAYTKDLYPSRLSLPFVFEDVQIEFCAGLATHPDGRRFVISYGVRDAQAKLAMISHQDVAAVLGVQL